MRTSAGALAHWPDSYGVYVVFENDADERPLYVGVAETQKLAERWGRQHLRNRSGGSALRRSLGLHRNLVREKLKLPARYYPDDVEAAITAFLNRCVIELHPTATGAEARALEDTLIERLNPILNIKRRRRLRR